MRDGFVKVAAVTPDIKVADCRYNMESIKKEISRCRKEAVKIAVFPELCITGYTCGDLFLQDILLEEAKKALRALVEYSKGCDMICFVGLPVMKNARLYNVCAVFCNGELLGMVPKRNIPNYSEFYELRHFEPGNEDVSEIKLTGYDAPVLFGGTGFESANQNMPQSLPERYEMGTMNISGIAGLNAALKWELDQGIETIWQKEQEHRNKLISLLQEYWFIKIVGNYPGCNYVGIVSGLIEGISSDSAGEIFDRCGIAVRTGLQCAPLAHQFIGTYPAGTIRFSVGYFTSEDDFEELRQALDYIEENL